MRGAAAPRSASAPAPAPNPAFAFASATACTRVQRLSRSANFRYNIPLHLSAACADMSDNMDEESQMRAARAEIMAVSDMFHR